MTFNRLLPRAAFFRRGFHSSKTDTVNPNWLRVSLAFGTSALLWGLLFKQRSADDHEYKVRNGLE